VKAVLLVGGQGTRLRPLTFSIPKPLLPVGERPLLQIIIEQLRDAGISELVLATGYQAELIQAFCGDGSKFGVPVSYVKEDQPLGTAGPIALARGRLTPGEPFLLMNGDILTKLDFRAFFATARQRAWDLTVGYTTYVHTLPFGVLSLRDERVEGVVEKPSHEYLVSAGIYCVGAAAVPFVPDRQFFTMPDLMRALIAAGRSVGAYHIRESWMGLESVDHFEEAVRELVNAPLK
jgi:NDP-sugar pyrophosphorylase family protein